jgi:hypothetical protein
MAQHFQSSWHSPPRKNENVGVEYQAIVHCVFPEQFENSGLNSLIFYSYYSLSSGAGRTAGAQRRCALPDDALHVDGAGTSSIGCKRGATKSYQSERNILNRSSRKRYFHKDSRKIPHLTLFHFNTLCFTLCDSLASSTSVDRPLPRSLRRRRTGSAATMTRPAARWTRSRR